MDKESMQILGEPMTLLFFYRIRKLGIEVL
jgi:hypothetical protein